MQSNSVLYISFSFLNTQIYQVSLNGDAIAINRIGKPKGEEYHLEDLKPLRKMESPNFMRLLQEFVDAKCCILVAERVRDFWCGVGFMWNGLLIWNEASDQAGQLGTDSLRIVFLSSLNSCLAERRKGEQRAVMWYDTFETNNLLRGNEKETTTTSRMWCHLGSVQQSDDTFINKLNREFRPFGFMSYHTKTQP